MKLATRVSAHFLTGLAVILIGNSALLFGVARFYLYRHFDEQLQSSLNTLVAAVEVEDDDVKWEASDHTVTLGTEQGIEDIRWVVFNEVGTIVEHSRNLASSPQDAAVLELARGSSAEAERAGWRFLQYRLAAPHPKPVAERAPLEHAALTVLVARSLSDLNATLQWLAVGLTALPALCWLLSAVAGQWFIRKAIEPVRAMAIGARAIRADNTAARLPVAPSGDELEELGQAFNGLLDELFAAYERQRRFAGDAAHQLRTPLTVLQGQVEVALRRTRTPEEYAATLGIVKQEVAAFSETVETLLALARPQTEGAPSDLQLLEFPGWLEDYLLKWKTHPRAGDLRLESESQSGRTSPRLLAQLLDVLVSNALKYSTAGSPIVIRSKGASGGVEIFVEDQGMGIAAGDQKAIFEPFFRAPQARQSGTAGTGLGLAIAARIAAALGGTLSCSSELGQGSRFRLTLPQAI